MSTVGKVFVLINLVLSLVVLGAAAALLSKSDMGQVDLDAARAQATELQAQLDQTTSDFQARERVLQQERDQFQSQLTDLDVTKANLQRSNDKLELDNQQLRDDVSKITARLDSIESTLQTTAQRNAELEDQNGQLRTEALEAKSAQREAETAGRDAQDALAGVQRELDDFRASISDLETEAREKGALVDLAVSQGFDPTIAMAAPLIEATVAEVDDDYNFVILDKGSNDDVQRGYTFEVYRGGDYLGRVKVSEVYGDYATANIEFKAEGAELRRFDRATTHLN